MTCEINLKHLGLILSSYLKCKKEIDSILLTVYLSLYLIIHVFIKWAYFMTICNRCPAITRITRLISILFHPSMIPSSIQYLISFAPVGISGVCWNQSQEFMGRIHPGQVTQGQCKLV